MSRTYGQKTKYGISFYGRLAQRSEQPAHNRSVLGSNPRASITFFVKQVYLRKLPVETEFIIFSSTGSTPKACEDRDAACRSTDE